MLHFQRFTILLASVVFCSAVQAAEGAKVVSFYGYDDCIQLRNDQVSVVLCPAAGGRVLEYSLARHATCCTCPPVTKVGDTAPKLAADRCTPDVLTLDRKRSFDAARFSGWDRGKVRSPEIDLPS